MSVGYWNILLLNITRTEAVDVVSSFTWSRDWYNKISQYNLGIDYVLKAFWRSTHFACLLEQDEVAFHDTKVDAVVEILRGCDGVMVWGCIAIKGVALLDAEMSSNIAQTKHRRWWRSGQLIESLFPVWAAGHKTQLWPQGSQSQYKQGFLLTQQYRRERWLASETERLCLDSLMSYMVR